MLNGLFERALCWRWSERRVGWQVRVLRGHSDDVRSVAFSRDGKWVVSGSDDHLVKIWDVATGAEVRSFEGVRFDSLKPQNVGWRCTVFFASVLQLYPTG